VAVGFFFQSSVVSGTWGEVGGKRADDLYGFSADADDLTDEADDVFGIVGIVGVADDAGAIIGAAL
jgi:hypothetical protein